MSEPACWSDAQRRIFVWFLNGIGHLLVRARAGTGKTTTIIKGITHAPAALAILLCAFNKRIEQELARRVTRPNATVKTSHALGFACVLRYWTNVRVAKPAWKRAAALAEKACGGRAPDPIKKLVAKLCTKGREMAPYAKRVGDLTDIAYAFDCVPDEEWEKSGFDQVYVEQAALAAMQWAAKEKPVDTGIDFADMIYLPLRNRWLTPTYDMVVIDEGQDWTTAQLDLALGSVKPGGRICLVGDDRQAMYGFRGAAPGSLDKLKVLLKAAELPLTTTYRCGRKIVEAAKVFVPDFEAGPDNPEGEIRELHDSLLVETVAYGDFVLSRKNAPLAQLAMKLIRAQRRVRVAGKEIGEGLIALVQKIGQRAADEIAFLDALAVWEDREVARAIRLGHEDRVLELRDKAETLEALADGAETVDNIVARIAALFTDDGLGDAGVITLSSVHKAKGLEADRVFCLRDTFDQRLPPGKTQTPQQLQEEQNIKYVAITRAKLTLVWVSAFAALPAPPDTALGPSTTTVAPTPVAATAA